MSTRFFGTIKAGTTSVSLDMLLLKTADGTPDTGKLAAGLSAYYHRAGAVTVAIALSDLGSLTAAFAVGGIEEVADGLYRVDVPDAAFAGGSDTVTIVLKDGTTAIALERLAIEAHGPDDIYSLIGGINGTVTAASSLSVTFTLAGSVVPLPGWAVLLSKTGQSTQVRYLVSTSGANVWVVDHAFDVTPDNTWTIIAFPDNASAVSGGGGGGGGVETPPYESSGIVTGSPTPTSFTVTLGTAATSTSQLIGNNIYMTSGSIAFVGRTIATCTLIDANHAILGFSGSGFPAAPSPGDNCIVRL